MKINAIYKFLKKPIVAGLLTFGGIFFVMLFIAYLQYFVNENKEQNELNNEVALIKEKLQSLVMYSYSATKSLAYIVERNGIPEDFDDIAKELLSRNKYFDVVELVDGNGVITHVYPLENNEVIGFNILKSATSNSGALETIKRKDFFIAGPINLKQGGVAMISRQPIFINNKFSGFSAVVTRLSTFFNDLNINQSNESEFVYQLSKVNQETGEEAFFLENDVSEFQKFAVPIEMEYGEWKLYVVPANKELNPALWVGVFGFVLALLSGWVMWFFVGQTERFNRLIKLKLASQEKLLKSVHEISRKKIEQSEFNLNKAQKIAGIGSWELNLENNELIWSREMFRIFEKDPKTFEVTNKNYFESVHPEDKAHILETYKNAVGTKQPFQLTYRLLFEGDRIKYVDEQCEILYDDNEQPVKVFGTTQDVTQRVISEKELLNYKNNLEELVNLRTEELNDSKEALLNLLEDINSQSVELEKEKVKAQSADLMKSAFLATMSHELRTPMNSIIGFTGILLKELAGPLNDEQKKQLNMVKNSGEHLLRLINDILDISKIEAGKLKVAYYPFDYVKCINKTIEFLEPQAAKKSLSIEAEISATTIVLESDERRVEQILLNLLSNAIKFSKEGTIYVKVDVVGTNVETQVIDEGIGISEKDVVKLFMPFIQVERGLNRNHEGTGLGLAICKNLVEKLGGTIGVTSVLGEGSNFKFSLPLEHEQRK